MINVHDQSCTIHCMLIGRQDITHNNTRAESLDTTRAYDKSDSDFILINWYYL